MEENEVINEINEEVVNTMCEEVSNSNGNILLKVVAGITVIAAGIGGFILYKRHRKKSQVVKLEMSEIVEENIDNKENENSNEN